MDLNDTVKLIKVYLHGSFLLIIKNEQKKSQGKDFFEFLWNLYKSVCILLKHANSDNTKRRIDIFDWESTLNNLHFNDQVSVSGFRHQETIRFDERGPLWMIVL